MLKIKDNVNLKELEKFGFTNDKFNGLLTRQIRENNSYNLECNIEISSREIWVSEKGRTFCNGMYDDKYIGDLINADLVEKVSDENE